MSKEVVVYKSLLPYYVIAFLVLLLWVVAGEEFSQSGLLTAWSDPGRWIILTAAVMGTMLAPLVLLSWRMKQRVSVGPIQWNFEESEIKYDEFEHVVAEYTKGYSHLQSRFDVPLALLTTTIAVIALLLPLMIVDYFQQASGWAPYLFGLLLMAFGLAILRVVFLVVPNDATVSFPVVRARPLSSAVESLENTLGVSWAGVRLSIGESGGYYTLRSPHAVGRIEGIENSAWVEVEFDKSAEPSSVVAKVSLESGIMEFAAPLMDHSASLQRVLKEMVSKCVAEYVKAKGSDEILDELMTELGIGRAALSGTSGGASGAKRETDE